MDNLSIDTRSHQSQTTEEKLKIVDDVISKLEDIRELPSEKIRDLKYVRNALSPISRLSVEIIQEIFFLLSLTEDTNQRENLWYLYNKGEWDWISITKVSQHWRDIALACPILWTRIVPYRCIDRTRAYLARSRKVDLYIFCGHSTYLPDFSEFTDIMSAEYYRIREFRLTECEKYENWEDFLKIFTAGPMMRMRSLQICSDLLQVLGRNQECSPASFMPGARLDYLSLSGVTLPWDHHVFRGLIELTLEDLRFSSNPPSMSQIFSILENCPDLKKLKLKDLGHWFSESDDNYEPRSIMMPQLCSINVEGFDFKVCKTFCNSLKMSPDAVKSISCYGYPFNKPIPIPLELLDIRKQCSKVKITINDINMTFLSCDEEEDQRVSITLFWLPHVYLVKFPVSLTTAFGSIQILLNQPFWGNITAVDLDVRGTDYNDRWRFNNIKDFDTSAWIILLRAVQDLKLIMSYHTDLQACFVQALSEHNNMLPYNFRLPNLQNLDIEDASFAKSIYHCREDFYMTLLEHLSFRHKATCKKLRRFSLIRCLGVGKRQYEEIQKMGFCEEVYWESLGVNLRSDEAKEREDN